MDSTHSTSSACNLSRGGNMKAKSLPELLITTLRPLGFGESAKV